MNGQQSGANPGAMVAAGGGLLAVIGTFLPWATVSYSGAFAAALPSESATGLSDWRGIVALLGGLVAAGAAVGVITMKGKPNARTLATVAGIAGIVVVLASVLGYIGAGKAGTPEELATLESFGATVDSGAGIGLYLSAVGGLLAAIGGFMAKGNAGGEAMMPPAPATPPAA